MMQKPCSCKITALLLLLFSAGPAFAADPVLRPEDDKGIWTLEYENDIFTGTDSNYTNGERMAYLSPETTVPDWIEDMADSMPLFSKQGHKRWEAALGQSMFTPRDLQHIAAQANDRPFAGWLYATAGLMSDTGYKLDNLQLTVGMVGPASLAQQTQRWIHKSVVNDPIPQGWANQLRDEPGIILSYERKWRKLYESTPFGIGTDITPSMGINLGNIYTDASVGAMLRVGYDLPADYGPPIITPNLTGSDFFVPQKDFGWYLFTGVQGKAVGRNIFLDGNTFVNSRSVDKYPFVGELEAGIVFTFNSLRVGYTQTFNTKEFVGQKQYNNFGAVTLSLRY
ncbi:MAG TPA: lipid A deacylase LpxR family protein [Rickettsiales bacterium]|nr:lipid A deacylase LpxR family protein [Rickettsiales bacterium]